MKTAALETFDWSVTTYEGARREQLERWAALSFREKMLALEEMCDQAFFAIERRKKRGLPYIDPYTKEVVRPAPAPPDP